MRLDIAGCLHNELHIAANTTICMEIFEARTTVLLALPRGQLIRRLIGVAVAL
jgi:hypothetical protein